MKTKRPAILLLFSLLLLPSLLYAAPHRHGRYPGPKEYVRPSPHIVQKRAPGRAIDNIGYTIGSATGTKKIAVIIVEFPSAGDQTSGGHQLTSQDITGFETTLNYMKNFYTEASYDKLDIDITYFYDGGYKKMLDGSETPYVLPCSMSEYGTGDELGHANGLVALSTDSLHIVGPTVSYPAYNTVMVAHAGFGNESTYYDGDIWSALVDFDESKNGFNDAISVPAREDNASPIGVTCHEFGHALGLPDVYSTGINQTSIVGKWCLMDYGPWVNNGYTPPHPSAWCKKYLGWLTPIVISNIQQAQQISDISPVQLSSMTVYHIPILENTTEYFLVSYSTKSIYNPTPPGGGLLIWHVDEGIIDSTSFTERMQQNEINNYSHPTLTIVPADSSHPGSEPYGDSTDPWPGIKNVFTTPDSDSFSGQASGISLAGISFSEGKGTFSIIEVTVSDIVSINKIINYPNPAGRGYYHPQEGSGIITTFALSFTSIPQDITLTLYNLAGEKVLNVPHSRFDFQLGPSDDYEIVYEYDWDGKNERYEDVAPGVYFYRVKADNKTKIGKMAVVR